MVITNQSGLSSNVVSGWNFTGPVSSSVTDPVNVPDGQTQNTTADEPVACFNNTNNLAVDITLTAGTFSGTNIVTSEEYDISDDDNSKTFGSFASLSLGSDTDPSVTMGAGNYRGLYLKVNTGTNSGEATSSFTVTCEV